MTGRLFHLAPGKCNAPEPLRGPPSPRFNAVPYCGVCGGLGVWGKGGRQGRREPGAKWNRDGWTMDAVYFGCYLIRFGGCVVAVRQDAAGRVRGIHFRRDAKMPGGCRLLRGKALNEGPGAHGQEGRARRDRLKARPRREARRSMGNPECSGMRVYWYGADTGSGYDRFLGTIPRHERRSPCPKGAWGD